VILADRRAPRSLPGACRTSREEGTRLDTRRRALTIRLYATADYEACRALWVELTQRHRDIYADPTIGGGDPGAGFDAELADKALDSLFVAEADGCVVGMAGLLCQGDVEAEVEPVVVTADCRGCGVGAALVEAAVRRASELGVRYVGVRPVARNVDAMGFFSRCGFGIVGRVELFRDLRPDEGRTWLPGIAMHGIELHH